MSKRTHSLIACVQTIAVCWLLALLLAAGVYVVFVGNISAGGIADIALIAMIYILVILLVNVSILVGLMKQQVWSWYACVLFLGLHLMGILLPIAVFGLWEIFSLEVQSDFGQARSPVDDESHLNQLGP